MHPFPGIRIENKQLILGRPGLFSKRFGGQRNTDERDAAPQLLEDGAADEPARTIRPSLGPEKLWRKGWEAYEAGNDAEAEHHWRRALDRDPGMADALLGLHALNPSDNDLLEQLVEHIDRFGECQERFQRRLVSAYFPVGFAHEPIEVKDDVLRAWAGILSVRERYDEASAVLSRCRPSRYTNAVKLRLAFDRHDHDQCMAIAQNNEMPEALDSDIALLVGVSLIELGLHQVAADRLKAALKRSDGKVPTLALRYQLARCYHRLGDEKRYTAELQQIYAVDVSFADVAERLGIDTSGRTEVDDDSETLDAEARWEAIVAELEAGEPADSKQIHDNR